MIACVAAPPGLGVVASVRIPVVVTVAVVLVDWPELKLPRTENAALAVIFTGMPRV
jgi:hypothetical protein